MTSGTTTLIEKREELKQQLAAGENKTLGKAAADWTGHFVQKLTRNPQALPFWYNLLVLTLTPMLVEYLMSVLFQEYYNAPEVIFFRVLTMAFIFIMLLTLETYMGHCFSFAKNHLIEAMESIADLTDFQRWLDTAFSLKRQFYFGLAFAILFSSYFIITNPNVIRFANFFSIFSIAIIGTLVGAYFYFFFPGASLAVRFGSRYQFKLYTADPSNTEFIDHLSDTLSFGVYIAGAFVAAFTFIISTYSLLTFPIIILSIIAGWVPVTAFFVASQYVMRRIIIRGKWKTLNGIQAKIETLQSQEEIPTIDTIEHIRALIDYHNHIRTTHNSVLDLRAGLNFLNSLLLPLIALLLANMDKILDLIK